MNIHTVILTVHIICGFTALTIGIIPMVVQKGGRLYRNAGKIYALAMYGISITALRLFLLHPWKAFLQFLLCIGLLGFYFTFTGVRAITLHRKKVYFLKTDKLIVWLTFTASMLMLIYGVFNLYNFLINNGDAFFAILYIVFGLAMGSASRADLLAFKSKNSPQKMQWFFNHFIKILSAYIATFTAFCVVNVHFLPPLLVWVMPGIIGGTLITLLVIKYNRNFNKHKGFKQML